MGDPKLWQRFCYIYVYCKRSQLYLHVSTITSVKAVEKDHLDDGIFQMEKKKVSMKSAHVSKYAPSPMSVTLTKVPLYLH